jgi:cytochrome c2
MKRQSFVVAVAGVALVLGVACTGGGAPATPATGGGAAKAVEPGNVERGRVLFVQQCAACHVVQSIPQARGQIGPDLSNEASKPQVAGVLPNTPENMARWLRNPSAVKPGTAMPNLGLNEQQVQDLVAFMATLQ